MQRIFYKNKLNLRFFTNLYLKEITNRNLPTVTWVKSSSSGPEDNSTNDMIKDAFKAKKENSKIIKNQYPKFDLREKKKPELKDLLQELRKPVEETVSTTEKEECPEQSSPTEGEISMEKVCAHNRVESLYKHADILHFETANFSFVKQNLQDATKQTPDHKVDKDTVLKNNEIEKPAEIQQKEIKPDDSEVGSLLKMLMQSKINDTQVTEIMANVKLSPSSERIPSNVHSALRGGEGITRAEKEQMKKQDFRAGRAIHGGEETKLRKGRTGRLFTGPRTHYFDELFKIGNYQEKTFISRHELDWQEKLKNSVQKQAPANRFEEMMLKEHKLWPLPVDNEAGLDEENESTFEDHVFLDHHLDLFPERGNLRRFMELVVTGLQQNPYLSANQKVDTIHWFKDYFDKFAESDLEF